MMTPEKVLNYAGLILAIPLIGVSYVAGWFIGITVWAFREGYDRGVR